MDQAGALSGDRRTLLLALLCAGPPVIETAVLWLTGLSADRALALQVTSPAPWGQFHDLRWLLVLHNSWAALVGEAAGWLLLRSLLDAGIAWLCGRPSEGLLRRSAVFTGVSWIFLLPWTVLGFGMSVVPISWLFFTTIPPVFAVALACSAGPAGSGWWRTVPPRKAVSTAALVLGFQSLASLATTAAPAGFWIPIALAAGGANAWAWTRIVAAVDAADRSPRRAFPVAPIVSVGMVVVAVSGAAIAFAVVGSRRPAIGGVAPVGPSPAPVLVVSGFDSKLDRTTLTPGIDGGGAVRFSYRGLDATGDPLPYGADDTHRSLPVLARLLAAQVSGLRTRSGRPVAIVAESEGSLVTEVYLAAYPRAPVSRAILLSPLDQPGRVYYPQSGHEGFGVGTGAALSAITGLLGGISPVHLPADAPLLRSIVDHAPAVRGLLACRLPVPETLLEPLADALADPLAPPSGIPSVVLPAFHGGLLTNATARHDIDRLLAGRPAPRNRLVDGLETVLRGAGAGWQVPSLPLAVYNHSPDHPSCAAMRLSASRYLLRAGRN